ncbi:hypothetical protein AURDEDRAFT_123320 [Auricularia subglabra TFB-10046 SS5]|nr:hypothetical protein AURDEDRAFT_123320 [Auricularia subglabra TFB-10046 SS5]
MLRTAVLALIASTPLAVAAVPAFKTRVDTLSSSYDAIRDVHVYVVHRQMSTRHTAVPMPLEYPRYNSDESTVSTLRTEQITSRSLLTGTSLLNSKLDQLCAYRDDMDASGSILRGLAAIPPTERASQPLFTQQCASELLNFQQALGAYHSLLSELCLESSLANLVRHVDLESTLADVAVSVGSTLEGVKTITVNVPSIGASVGQIVYGIGNTLNELATNIERDTESGLLASLRVNLGHLQPKLSSLARLAGDTACGCAVPALASVCL